MIKIDDREIAQHFIEIKEMLQDIRIKLQEKEPEKEEEKEKFREKEKEE